MRLPTMSAVPDYSAPKKGRGRTRKNYTNALFDMPKQKRGRKPKPIDPSAVAKVKRVYVKREATKNARGFPIQREYKPRATKYNARGFPILSETKPRARKAQPANTVLNPISGRYVKINGFTHLKLLRAGVFSSSVGSG